MHASFLNLLCAWLELCRTVAIPHPGHGLGDRLRGTMYAARLAATTNRVLLISWDRPGLITDYLVPATNIDWRLTGTPAERIKLNKQSLLGNNTDIEYYGWGMLSNRELRTLMIHGEHQTQKQFMVVQSNEISTSPCGDCPKVGTANSWALVCLFNFLYKLSDEVEARAQQQLQQLYSTQDLRGGYAAAHLRLGHLNGEVQAINRFKGAAKQDSLSGVLRTVSCGLELANRSGIAKNVTPLLLLTDHASLRAFAQNGKLANVVAPTYKSLHIGTARRTEIEQHYSTFVDLALFAKAKCVIQSTSGYSHMGWLLGGGTNCTMTVDKCMASCTKDPSTHLCVRR